MNLLRRALLYWHTIRHLKTGQINSRLVRKARDQYVPVQAELVPEDLSGGLPEADSFPTRDPWNTTSAVSEGKFCFLNKTRVLGRPVNWQPSVSSLWQFNLHYFNYLHLLGEEEQIELCCEWVDANSLGTDPGWHPYPTSLRIINWCRAQLDNERILKSLYRQAAYLYRNLETHLLGNHLLENARALVFAGCFFTDQGEAADWLERGLDIYREQTPEQILEDGGHFERSPMYHALMLEGYLDVLNLLPAGHSDRGWLKDAARRMGDFLVSATHPSGRIALLNDATREIAVPTERLCQYMNAVIDYQPKQRNSFPETGYFIHRGEGSYLIIDGGPIGPDYLPAHAHADIFSYELSLGGTSFIVDTGVHGYDGGNMRDYVRSTKAHNTVCVDGVDQAECWNSFRVARRYPPQDVSFIKQDNRSVFEGTFDGYAHLIGDQIEHHRRIEADSRQRRITIEDTVTGHSEHTVRSRIHLHPEVNVHRGHDTIELERDGHTVRMSTGDSPVRLEKSWYCPEFGMALERDVIVIEAKGLLPTRILYRIHY